MKNSYEEIINKVKLGQRIREIRNRVGYSLEDFGQAVSPPANKSIVSRWESGKSIPNNQRIKSISKLGSMTSENLLFGDETEFIENVIRNIYRQKDSLSEKYDLLDNIDETELVMLLTPVVKEYLEINQVTIVGNLSAVSEAAKMFIRAPRNVLLDDQAYIESLANRLEEIEANIKNNRAPTTLEEIAGQYDFNVNTEVRNKVLSILYETSEKLNHLIKELS